MRLEPSYRRELRSLIVNSGLEEDFMEWLSIQGIRHVFGQLDNIPDELIVAYLAEKKLLETGVEEKVEYVGLPDEPGGGVYVRSRRNGGRSR